VTCATSARFSPRWSSAAFHASSRPPSIRWCLRITTCRSDAGRESWVALPIDAGAGRLDQCANAEMDDPQIPGGGNALWAQCGHVKSETRSFSTARPDIRKRCDLRKRPLLTPAGTRQTPTRLAHNPWVLGSCPSRPTFRPGASPVCRSSSVFEMLPGTHKVSTESWTSWRHEARSPRWLRGRPGRAV
jgi:hypothetical protein